MEILSYLTELIKTHKEVGIPGLGTIYKKKSPGRYDIETHSFLPPSYVLNFTSDLKEQVLLTELISKKKNISADAATYFIEQFSQEILDKLSDRQEADLGELGIFSTTSGSLTFIPKESNNFGFDFYGLPALKDEITSGGKPEEKDPVQELPDKDELHITEEQLELEDNNADLSDGTVTEDEYIEEPEYIEIEPGHIEEEERKMPAYLKAIIVLIAILIIATITYFIRPDLFEGVIKNTSKPDTTKAIKENEQLKIDSAAHTDSIKRSNEKAISAIDSVKDSVMTKTAVKPIDTAITYEIIAASLLNKKEADNFLEDMKKKGIPAKIANMPGKRIKISIGTFINEQDARNQLKVLKKTTRIPGIYIYPIRHTNNPK